MSFVYAIESGGLIKIGVAKNPEKRMATLQTGCPTPMRLLEKRDFEWWEQALLAEHGIHSELRNQRVLGEWYRPYPDDPVRWIEIFHKEHKNLMRERLAVVKMEPGYEPYRG